MAAESRRPTSALHPGRRAGDAALLGAVAGLDLVLHLALAGRYGYWIDELYFVACGDHLDWGYVDHPPLIAGVAHLARLLFGDSLVGLRVFPALAAALLVFLTGWFARALGGGRAAQILAAVATCVVPVYALFGNVLTMNSFEPLFWVGCAYLAVRVAEGASARLWLAFGLVAGVGLLNKYSMAFFAVALGAGLLLSPQRRFLLQRWFWSGALLALLIAAPNLLWEYARGWPTLELLANAQRYQHEPVTPLQFVWGQVQIMHPLLLPLWLAGLWFLLVDPKGKRFRFLGWTFAVQFAAFLFLQAKTYYLAPIYPMLFAAGGVLIEQRTPVSARAWATASAIGVMLLGFVPLAPYVLPILPVNALPRYLEMLGMKEVRSENRPMGDVPQIFADMLAWDELVAEIARVYGRLTPDERRDAVIWGSNYGAAAAVDVLGRSAGLPRAISGHQNYYLWRAPGPTPGVFIAVGFEEFELAPWFERVEWAGEVRCDLCMPDRRVTRIYLGRHLVVPLDEFWPLAKCWTCDEPRFALERPPRER